MIDTHMIAARDRAIAESRIVAERCAAMGTTGAAEVREIAADHKGKGTPAYTLYVFRGPGAETLARSLAGGTWSLWNSITGNVWTVKVGIAARRVRSGS